MAVPKKPAEQEQIIMSKPKLICHLCDNLSTMEGHIVEGGKVIQCPFITVNLSMTPKKPEQMR